MPILIVSPCEFCSKMLKTNQTTPNETSDFRVEEVDRMYADTNTFCCFLTSCLLRVTKTDLQMSLFLKLTEENLDAAL